MEPTSGGTKGVSFTCGSCKIRHVVLVKPCSPYESVTRPVPDSRLSWKYGSMPIESPSIRTSMSRSTTAPSRRASRKRGTAYGDRVRVGLSRRFNALREWRIRRRTDRSRSEAVAARAGAQFRSMSFFMSSVIGMTSKSLKNISQSVPPCICSPSLPVFSHFSSMMSDVQNPFSISTKRSP